MTAVQFWDLISEYENKLKSKLYECMEQLAFQINNQCKLTRLLRHLALGISSHQTKSNKHLYQVLSTIANGFNEKGNPGPGQTYTGSSLEVLFKPELECIKEFITTVSRQNEPNEAMTLAKLLLGQLQGLFYNQNGISLKFNIKNIRKILISPVLNILTVNLNGPKIYWGSEASPGEDVGGALESFISKNVGGQLSTADEPNLLHQILEYGEYQGFGRRPISSFVGVFGTREQVMHVLNRYNLYQVTFNFLVVAPSQKEFPKYGMLTIQNFEEIVAAQAKAMQPQAMEVQPMQDPPHSTPSNPTHANRRRRRAGGKSAPRNDPRQGSASNSLEQGMMQVTEQIIDRGNSVNDAELNFSTAGLPMCDGVPVIGSDMPDSSTAHPDKVVLSDLSDKQGPHVLTEPETSKDPIDVEAMVSQLGQENKDLQQRNNALQQQVEQLRQELNQATEKLEQLTQDKTQSEEKLGEAAKRAREEVQKAKQRAKEQKDLADALNKENQKLSKQLVSKDAASDGQFKEIQRLQNSLEQATRALNEQKKQKNRQLPLKAPTEDQSLKNASSTTTTEDLEKQLEATRLELARARGVYENSMLNNAALRAEVTRLREACQKAANIANWERGAAGDAVTQAELAEAMRKSAKEEHAAQMLRLIEENAQLKAENRRLKASRSASSGYN